MKTYKTGVMSTLVELQADSIDEAICVTILFLDTNAPIAVYDCDETARLTFPYDSKGVDSILAPMGERLRECYQSCKVIS